MIDNVLDLQGTRRSHTPPGAADAARRADGRGRPGRRLRRVETDHVGALRRAGGRRPDRGREERAHDHVPAEDVGARGSAHGFRADVRAAGHARDADDSRPQPGEGEIMTLATPTRRSLMIAAGYLLA